MLSKVIGSVSHQKFLNFSDLSKPDFEGFKSNAVISFDCFDTIIWRSVDKPTDLFFILQQSNLYQKHELTAHLRMAAERHARDLKFVQLKSREVTLKEIYKQLLPDGDDKLINEFIELEISIEAKYQYTPPGIIPVLKEIIAGGKKIVITSDTYFDKSQIRYFLANCLPAEINSNIYEIFTSSDYQMDKRSGLLSLVCRTLKVNPSTVLHVGDSEEADHKGAIKASVNSLQFSPLDIAISQMMRMSNIGLSILDPEVRKSAPILSPFKSLYSRLNSPVRDDELIGYVGLGPIIFCFVRYIYSEFLQLKENHQHLKMVYLLRDGYLPGEACHILAGEEVGKYVRISRFASYAASFRSKHDIIKYVSKVIMGGRYKDILKQLLINEDDLLVDINTINCHDKLINLVSSEKMVKLIVNRSKQYMTRLFKYLQKSCQLTQGDTLLLIDLGYSATAQENLSRVMKDEYQITLIGRYLICLDVISSCKKYKNGLMSKDYFSTQALHTVVAYIAILEQLCTTTDSSVVDFDQDGNPIMQASSFSQDQYDKLINIQAACKRFCYDAKSLSLGLSSQELARTALAWLSRLIFYPSKSEIHYLETFMFDLNMGTSSVYEMLNIKKSIESMQKHGLFNAYKMSDEFRTNCPTELRYSGLELPVFLMNQHLHDFDFTQADLSFNKSEMDVMIISDNKPSLYTLSAMPTHNGYYTLTLPLHKKISHISLLLGEKFRAMQIQTIYSLSKSGKNENDLLGELVCDGVVKLGDLFVCENSSAMLSIIIKPESDFSSINVVYRPISL